jgi:hypothetical protein
LTRAADSEMKQTDCFNPELVLSEPAADVVMIGSGIQASRDR